MFLKHFALEYLVFYASEVNEGKYIRIPNSNLFFSDRVKTFFVGFSYLLNTDMTIEKNVCLSACL